MFVTAIPVCLLRVNTKVKVGGAVDHPHCLFKAMGLEIGWCEVRDQFVK